MKKTLVQLAISLVFFVVSSQTVNAQWVQTSGHSGALAVSGSNIFAGTYYGVFLSTDSGTSWSAVNAGLADTFVISLAVSGSNIFAGTAVGGVFLSTNNGTSWKAVNSGLPVDTGITSFAVQSFAVSGRNIFAGTDYGVFLSTDSGTSWSAVNSGLTSPFVNSLAVSGSNIFAGTYGGVFLSTNSGKSWIAVNSGLPAYTSIWSLAVSGSNIFAGTNNDGVYLSTDSGKSWTPVNSGLPIGYIVHALVVNDSNIFAGTYAEMGSSEGVVYIYGSVFLSTNSGTSWTEVNSGLPNTGIQSLAVSDGSIFAGTSCCGVWRRQVSEILGAINFYPKNLLIQDKLKIHSPNYKNSIVTVGFSLSHSDQVTINVYNLSGRKITSLVNGNLGAGIYSMPWDTRNVAAGNYVVRMQVGSKVYLENVLVCR